MQTAKRFSQAEEVEAVLQKRIQALPAVDGRLPSETELAAEFGVSRVTVREALSSLERRGLILRRQGLGTFVNRTAMDLQLRLDESVEFNELIRTAGYQSDVGPASHEIAAAPEGIARQLLIEPGAAVLNLHKVFTANDTPIIHCLNVIPLDLLPGDRQVDLLQTIDPRVSVYALLVQPFGQRVAYQVSEVGACQADGELAGLLHANPGIPLLTIEEVGYNQAQRPVFYALEHYLTGLIHLRFIRKPVYSVYQPS